MHLPSGSIGLLGIIFIGNWMLPFDKLDKKFTAWQEKMSAQREERKAQREEEKREEKSRKRREKDPWEV